MCRWLLATVFSLVVPWAPPAMACTPFDKVMIFFAYGSAEVSSYSMRVIQQAGGGRPGQMLPAACQSFVITGHVDTAEVASSGSHLAISRAEAVGRAVIGSRGGRVVQIEDRPNELLVQTGPDVQEAQNRFAQVKWTLATKGLRRCDPTTKIDPGAPTTTCGTPNYYACYLELEDGTVCNFSNVPNPNPVKYSVIDNRE
jgi:hypothetical protein